MINEFVYEDELIETSSEFKNDKIEISIGENKYSITPSGASSYSVEFNGAKVSACCIVKDNKSYVDINGVLLELAIPSDDNGFGGGAGSVGEKDKVFAPMPGKVVKLLVSEGDEVTKKQPLVIVEAMKMENQVNSPSDGKVKKINFSDGDQVDTDTPIIELDIEE
ncbi:MAG: biotin/lipoyl-binding protein [candidate division Zixibacteria bacterium]|nr:biotin/lipoyl-binding protein [candidate division Zixibacteria bacterium]